MPTASPIMTARRGAVAETMTHRVTVRIKLMETPTPKRAPIKGIAADRSDPKVKAMTPTATNMPMISVGSTPGVAGWNMDPPAWKVTASSDPAVAILVTAPVMTGVMRAVGRVICRLMMAAEPVAVISGT